MSDLTDRLRVHPTASHFLKPAHLYQSLIEEREEAAHALEAQEALIKEMVSALTALRDETVVCCPDCADQVDAALSKAPPLK